MCAVSAVDVATQYVLPLHSVDLDVARRQPARARVMALAFLLYTRLVYNNDDAQSAAAARSQQPQQPLQVIGASSGDGGSSSGRVAFVVGGVGAPAAPMRDQQPQLQQDLVAQLRRHVVLEARPARPFQLSTCTSTVYLPPSLGAPVDYYKVCRVLRRG